jgi:putative cell wall-binding protein
LTGQRSGQPRRTRTAGKVALALACVAALLAVPGLAAAQPDGHTDLPAAMPGDRLLVSHRSATGHELHTVDHGGDGRTVLTSDEADFAGAWSPDGRHVAFHRVEAGGGGGLWVVPSDGGVPRRLADGGHSPSWSPDSTRIVHSPSTEAEPVPLAITDLAGSTTPIAGTDGGIDPAWSPDGYQIAYVDPLRDFALVLTRVDGSDRTVSLGQSSEPTWSPASDRVAYVERVDGGPRLMMIDGAAGERFFLTDRFDRLQQLAYSPTGGHVAFAAAEGDGHLDLWTIRVADGHLQRLTDDAVDDFGPSWTASSELIAFTRTTDLFAEDAARDAFAVPSAGGPARQLTDSGADHVVAHAPGLTLRMAGQDRVGTAVALSRTFSSAEVVVIARADAYPDALAGAPLAAVVGGPILLTGSDRLHPSLPAELARLGAEKAYLLGGHAALSQQVEDDLAAAGVEDVQRVAGSDRFGTAARVLDELDVLGAEFERVFVVEGRHDDPGRGWPDALSASGVAAHTGEPILLVTRDDVPPETASALQGHSSVRATIVGGTAAVSAAVEERIDELVASVERVAGADRYATSAAAADLAVADGSSAVHPWLGTGRDWPDALAAAPAVARDGGVLLLVDGRDPVGSAATHAWLPGRDIQRGVVVGGTVAITPQVRAAIESSLVSGG